jgi:hypothetical protein
MNRKLLIIAGSIAAFLVIVAIGLSIRQVATFHLVKTDPKNSSTPNQYTAVTFTFNENLAPNSATVNYLVFEPGAKGSTKVSGKSVTFTPETAFVVGTKYTFTLKGIKSSSGHTLQDTTLTFTPQYTAYADLPADIKKRLTADPQDTPQPYRASTIAIANSSLITDRGVTTDQMDLLKVAFWNYFHSVNQEQRSLTVTNLTKVPHDHYSTSDTVNFDVLIGDKLTYKAKLVYSDLTNIRLYLSNPANGALIFDSQLITPDSINSTYD